MLRTDAVMDAAQPGFEIGEDEVNNGQEGFGDLWITALRNSGMEVVEITKLRVATPVVGNDGGAGRDSAFDKSAQRSGASIRDHGESDTSGIPPVLSLIETAAPLALSHLDGAGHENHVVNASSLAASTAANIGFIGLDDITELPADSVLIRANHASAELMENLEGGLVARQSELPLDWMADMPGV